MVLLESSINGEEAANPDVCRPDGENPIDEGNETAVSTGALADGDDGSTLVSSIHPGWVPARVSNRLIGPGAYHVVPRTTLTRNSGLVDPTAGPGANNSHRTSSTEGSSGANTTNDDELPIVVTATLVEDGSNDSGSGDQPPSALSSTLVTHAMSVSDDSGSGAPPALSLVDQRVVDERIRKLKGEHKRTLSKQRSTVVGAALLVLLAIVLVVSIAVPLTRPTAVLAASSNATNATASAVELLAEWDRCTISAECKVWSDGTGCCTGKYSGGAAKCTPLSPWFNQRTNECVFDVPATYAPTPAPNSSKSDWAVCSENGECRAWAEGTGCCTGKYSGGVPKCTPLSPWFNERTNECVANATTATTAAPNAAPTTTDGEKGAKLPYEEPCSAVLVETLERRDTPVSGGNPFEFYGKSSAVSGSMVVIGSPGTEGIGLGGNVHKLGRVHIFQGTLVDGEGDSDAKWTWEEEKENSPLEPAERETKYGLVESFGFRVATSDDVLAVTAFSDGFGLRRLGE